ncbi:MAG: efflux RND transporter permease subunit, partial [Holophagales bacterium]|nr:efflux RND transporter permease subunit [Holophagales bacterium]
VLVDYTKRLRSEGRGRTEAVLLAADRRFRPILMTALTTICGMVPLVLGGTTSIGMSYKSFGVTLIGGMAVATLLTLLVVPVTYTFFDDVRERLLALAGSLRLWKAKPGTEGGEAPLPESSTAGG